MGPIKHDDDTNSHTNRRCSIKSIESDYDVSDLSGKPLRHGNITTSVSLNSNLELKNISEMTLIQEQLWIFSSEGDLSEVKRILKQGVEVHFLHSEFGNSPLHVAVENGHTEVVKAILNQESCNPDFKDHLGRTSLMHAAVFDDVEMVNILYKQGADIDMRDNTGKTALLLALQDACRHSSIYLIKHGCDLDVVDRLGQSALFLVLNTMELDVVKLVKKLIKAGYDVTKDTPWLQAEGMTVETVTRKGFAEKLMSKLRSRLTVLHHHHRQIFAESSYGSKMIRIMKTCE